MKKHSLLKGLYFFHKMVDLKIDPILHLSSKLKQVVQNPTRLNPPKLLDPIITTLSSWYQVPECLLHLDNDPDVDGKPADHLMVKMKPISSINNKSTRQKKFIKFRPFTPNSLNSMQEWIDQHDWTEIKIEEKAHKKMEVLQKLLVLKYEEFFPEKTKSISVDESP